MSTWRLIESGAMGGAISMALDAALLEQAGEHRPPILRFYTWQPACVTLGRHQPAASVDLAACRKLGVDAARRPTGGGAILHEAGEVTFSFIAPLSALGVSGVMESYRALSAAIVVGLRLVGVRAKLVDSEGEPQAGPGSNPVCFARRARCDISCDGRKLVGSAQRHRRGVVLQQNSLPLELAIDRQRAVFGTGAEEAAGVITLAEAAGRPVSYDEACQAIAEGCCRVFGARFLPAGPDAGESRAAEGLVEGFCL